MLSNGGSKVQIPISGPKPISSKFSGVFGRDQVEGFNQNQNGFTQPAIAITPAMKKSALYEGQPLFQLKGKDGKGRWTEAKERAKKKTEVKNGEEVKTKAPDPFAGQTPESEKLGFLPAGFRIQSNPNPDTNTTSTTKEAAEQP